MKIKNIIVESYNAEYDDEAGMAQGNLYTIAKAAQGLLDTIDDRDNLPEWTQEKIAKVEGMLVTVWNYLQSQKAQGINPQQGVAENIDDDEDCDLCNGTGEGLYDGESCHKCHGTGVLSHQHSDDDFDEPDDDYDNYDEPESHYEKYVRTRGLEEQGIAEGSVTKKPQPYNDPDWAKNLPKEKLDALAGPRYKKDKKDKPVAERSVGLPRTAAASAEILSASDNGKTITITVRTPSGEKRTISNSDPAVIQKWLNVKYGLRLPQSIAKKFVGMPAAMAEDVDEAMFAPKSPRGFDPETADFVITMDGSPYMTVTGHSKAMETVKMLAAQQANHKWGVKSSKESAVAEGRPRLPDPQNYDSDWDYYNDRDEEAPEDNDADYENMIDEPNDWFDESRQKVGNMDADAFDDAISRLKKLAGAGPLKTVYDPEKRVYKNVPTAQQPTKQPTK